MLSQQKLSRSQAKSSEQKQFLLITSKNKNFQYLSEKLISYTFMEKSKHSMLDAFQIWLCHFLFQQDLAYERQLASEKNFLYIYGKVKALHFRCILNTALIVTRLLKEDSGLYSELLKKTSKEKEIKKCLIEQIILNLNLSHQDQEILDYYYEP